MRLPVRIALAVAAIVIGLSGFALGGASRSLEVLYAFTGAGGVPRGDMARSADGTLYGVTQYDGIFSGSVFALTPNGSGGFEFRQLHAFKADDGVQPMAGLLLGSDGFLYGTTGGAGPSGWGTVFRMDTSGNLTTLHAFGGSDGGGPQGALIEGGDGFFYGTTRFGGPANEGTVYRLDAAGNFTSLHAFSGPDGRQPFGHLYRAPSGDLYGTTYRGGGDPDVGTVFRLSPGGTLTTIHVFAGYPSADGAVPLSGLTPGPDGNLYGSTQGGGDSQQGTVFRLVLPATVEVVHSFGGSDGSAPHAEILPDGSGNLVGTTYSGGAGGKGTIFRLTPGGVLTTLYQFSGPDGDAPLSSVVTAPDGTVYTTTWAGGSSTSNGVVIQVDTLGTATILHDFRADGVSPQAPLLEASDGMLYGTTSWSGNGFGALYRLKPSGQVETFATLKDVAADYTTGSLAESDDGWFYGTAPGYGPNNDGSVFRAKLDGTVEMLHVFSNDEGTRPMGGLIRASDGNDYGATHESNGSVFRIDGADNGFTLLQVLDGTVGGAPCGRFLETAPGVLTATASLGGPDQGGTVFQITTAGVSSLVHGFSGQGPDGSYPCSDRLSAATGSSTARRPSAATRTTGPPSACRRREC